MNTENSFASSSDEAVFDNRNKDYGAYSIRKSYTTSLTKGSGGSLLVAGFFIAAVQAALLLAPEIHPKIVERPIICGLVPVPDIKRNQEQKRVVRQEPKTNATLPPRAVTTPVDPPEVELPQTSNSGSTAGDPSGDPPQVGTGIEASSVPVVAEGPKTVDIAEVMPEFEGGAKAMYKFLRKHLRYPHTDQQGTVYVRFIVDITGTVTGVEVIRGVSGLLDKEASRVIAIMPKWKPASQHGNPVNVRMVLPIKFEMGRE